MLFDDDILYDKAGERLIPLPSFGRVSISKQYRRDSLKNCCNPNCVVKTSILAPLCDVLSCLCQLSDFRLKSPKKN